MASNKHNFNLMQDQTIVAAFNRNGGGEGWATAARIDIRNSWNVERDESVIIERLGEIQDGRAEDMEAEMAEDPTDMLNNITTLDTVLEAVEELSMKIDRQTVVMSALLEDLTAHVPKPESIKRAEPFDGSK